MEHQNQQQEQPENQLSSSETESAPSPIAAALQRERAEWVSGITEALGEITIIVPREHIVAACAHLKTTPGLEFNFLSDICGFDRGPEEEPRFEVNYHLFSTARHHRVRLKVLVAEDDLRVPSVTGVWRTANWHERETYDLFGVIFDNHPDLRRILLPDDWQGHALRKDFPLRGYEPYSLE
jgi:NADH-quinone oxidoreductase subunit C